MGTVKHLLTKMTTGDKINNGLNEKEDVNRPLSWVLISDDLKDERNKIEWKYCADHSHAFTGLFRLKPGQQWPLTTHTIPKVYWILQGSPLVTLNNISNRPSPWQCLSIPPECPHSVTNDTDEEVVIAWIYLSLKDMVNPNVNYNFALLEELT